MNKFQHRVLSIVLKLTVNRIIVLNKHYILKRINDPALRRV